MILDQVKLETKNNYERTVWKPYQRGMSKKKKYVGQIQKNLFCLMFLLISMGKKKNLFRITGRENRGKRERDKEKEQQRGRDKEENGQGGMGRGGSGGGESKLRSL